MGKVDDLIIEWFLLLFGPSITYIVFTAFACVFCFSGYFNYAILTLIVGTIIVFIEVFALVKCTGAEL